MPDENQNPQTTEPDLGAVYAYWEFPEYDKHNRGRRWYIITFVILIGLFGYAYWDNNPLLAIILLLALFTFIMSEMRGPEFHSCALTEDGILVGQMFYPYEALRDFYIIYNPPQVKMLYLNPKSFFRPLIGIPLLEQDPVLVRRILASFVTENMDKEEEPTTDFLSRILKL